MTTVGYWVDRTSDSFRELDGERAIAVLPMGASEQHGPHLPLSTDRDLVDEVVRRALPLLDGAFSVLVLPTLAVCKSNEHTAFPGTLTLSAETLVRVVMEIGESVARAGVRRMVLFNGHGGNVPVMDIAVRDLRARHGLLTASCSWYQMCGAERELDAREQQHGIHAGENETSAMLVARPALVRMDRARDFRSATEDWAEGYQYLGLGSRPGRPGWLMADLNPDGACGNAAAATAEKGERLLATAAHSLAGFLGEFATLTLPPAGVGEARR
jgi:creatinine amidohydrolase